MNGKIRHPFYSRLFSLFIPAFCFLLAGCSPIVRAEQVTITGSTVLAAHQSIGQSLVPNYDGLTGIEIYLDPKILSGTEGEILFRLSPISDQSITLAKNVLPLSQVTQGGFYRFQFPAIPQSNRKDYYFSLELVGINQIEIAQAPGTAYLDGAMVVDQQPVDAQLAFQIAYDPLWLAAGLGKEILQWIGILLIAAFIALPPGWAILSLLDHRWKERLLAVKLVFAASISLSIYPLLLLWTNLIGLHLGRGYAWAPPILGIVFLTWKNWPPRLIPLNFDFIRKISWPDLTFIFVMLVIAAVRFWSIRTLDVGLWGDSYQHTVISQLIVENGGLFNSWQPYAELTTFTYHFAFHTWVAIFHWITGIEVAQGVLWVGQLINGLSILALYPLAIKLVNSRWVGIITIMIAGLFLPVPMIYVNWGRYTQLAGQVILPAAIYLLWEWLENEDRKASWPILNWILWSGIGLAHYRVAILALLFLPAYTLARLPVTISWSFIKKITWIGLGSGVLFLPWFIRVFGGKIIALFGVIARLPSSSAGVFEDPAITVKPLLMYASPLLWIVTIVVLGWGLWQRNRSMLIFLFWWLLIFIAANPEWINLPGKELISSLTVAIAVYILIGPLLGAGLGQFLAKTIDQSSTWLNQARIRNFRIPQANRVLEITISLSLCLVALMAAISQKNLLEIDRYSLLARPDLRAFTWIKDHTPPDSKFLVNAFLAFNNYVPAGSDGGWWLALLTERGSTLPPINSGFEQGPTVDYLQKTNQLIRLIKEQSIDSDIVHQELKARQVTHIYVGHLHGKDLTNGELFLTEDLLASSNYHLVYHQDRVWIFEIR